MWLKIICLILLVLHLSAHVIDVVCQWILAFALIIPTARNEDSDCGLATHRLLHASEDLLHMAAHLWLLSVALPLLLHQWMAFSAFLSDYRCPVFRFHAILHSGISRIKTCLSPPESLLGRLRLYCLPFEEYYSEWGQKPPPCTPLRSLQKSRKSEVLLRIFTEFLK